jgi:hypothetical protein
VSDYPLAICVMRGCSIGDVVFSCVEFCNTEVVDTQFEGSINCCFMDLIKIY